MSKTPPMLTAPQIKGMLPKRALDSHKSDTGHVLIIAGSRRMSGAAVLAARGALRMGAGLVTVAIVESERSVITHQLPEALTVPLPETAEGALSEAALPVLKACMEKRRINALAVGPGLSIGPAVARVMKSLLNEWEQPMVLDADGLNNLSIEDLGDRANLIITPHVFEMAHLMRVEADMVKRERVRVAESAAQQGHLFCVLKGHHTVITDGQLTRINPTGNPAMATGGIGDVLTGAMAALLAQDLKPWDAACAGVYLHGLAADLVKISDRGLLATDVADALPRALAKIGVK